MKILIVDNDASTITTLEALLSDEATLQIDAAYSGQESLDKMTANLYDLVLLDVMMPNMSGMDVCKIMGQDQKLQTIPVLLMSSAVPIPPEEFLESLNKSGSLNVIKGVIEKPFTVENILSQIRKVTAK
jgi:CheY-like chemotaxis protein